MDKKKKRFVRILQESGFATDNELWVDTQTGVTYLWHSSGYGGGLTPLLDASGNPIISRVPIEND